MPITKEYYHNFFENIVKDNKERETIFVVLLNHHLIKAIEDNYTLYKISEAGMEFLEFEDEQ